MENSIMIAKDLITLVKEIETSYNVSEIKYDGFDLWPYIRSYIYIRYSYKNEPSLKKKVSYFDKVRKMAKAIISSDFRLLRKMNPVILFANGDDICVVNGEKKTKLFEAIRNRYGDKCVPIVIPVSGYKESPYESRINMDYISYRIAKEKTGVTFDPSMLQNKDILDAVITRLDIHNFDVEDFIRKIVAGKHFYKRFFKKVKPEKVFVSCYYDYARMPAIAVAKQMGIDTIELQHGYIGYDSPTFRAYAKTSKEPYADYFFSFGRKFSEIISDKIIDPDSVFEVGNGYLEIIADSEDKNKPLLREKYTEIADRKIICIIGNAIESMDIHMIRMAIGLLDRSDQYAVVFKPRGKTIYNFKHEYYFVEADYDVYQCMQGSDLTIATVSTCAFESLYVGTPVLLDNMDNIARIRFENYFHGIKSVFYVDQEGELETLAREALLLDRKEVMKEGRMFYADKYYDRVQYALDEIDRRRKTQKRIINENVRTNKNKI